MFITVGLEGMGRAPQVQGRVDGGGQTMAVLSLTVDIYSVAEQS